MATNNEKSDVKSTDMLFHGMVFRMRPCSAKARIKKHILVWQCFISVPFLVLC